MVLCFHAVRVDVVIPRGVDVRPDVGDVGELNEVCLGRSSVKSLFSAVVIGGEERKSVP